MNFNTLLSRILPKKKDEHPLSRLYGYQNLTNGKVEIVTQEARIIALVINNIATQDKESIDSILNDIINQFDSEGIRNRSGKKWTHATLLGLVRPVYAGIAVSKSGLWRKSKIYPSIVSIENVKQALKRVKNEKKI